MYRDGSIRKENRHTKICAPIHHLFTVSYCFHLSRVCSTMTSTALPNVKKDVMLHAMNDIIIVAQSFKRIQSAYHLPVFTKSWFQMLPQISRNLTLDSACGWNAWRRRGGDVYSSRIEYMG